MLEQAFGLLINEIALDIGSANIRVYAKSRDLFVEEPAVVIAEEQKGKYLLLEYGEQALQMVGRTPPHQQAIYPFQGGIQKHKLAEELISRVILKAIGGKSLLKPRSIVGFSQYFQEQAPKTLTSILQQTAGKDIQKINSLICSALGCALPIENHSAMMLLNIGFSGTELGIFCHSNIYRQKYIPIGGKHFNISIQQYIKTKYEALISAESVEQLKIDLCNLYQSIPDRTHTIPSKHTKTNQPMEITISSADICAALKPILRNLHQEIVSEFKQSSARVVTDLMQNGIVLCGGSAQLTDINLYLQAQLNLPVIVIDNPQRVNVMGAAKLLSQEPYAHWFAKV